MRQSFGETRSRVRAHHALISMDSHERVTLPHWPNAELVHLITPDMGAKFSMFLARATSEFEAAPPPVPAERFVLVRGGRVQLHIDGQSGDLKVDDFAYLPAGQEHLLAGDADAELFVLERPYLAGASEAPGVFVSSIGETPRNPMKGDERLQLQKLLPQEPSFDMEINIMDFAPGASLPYVETHFMEHGLLMLDGGGVYRLEDEWSPVSAGDAIWMGPYCPQWFAAVGRENARYLIYKNWNRDPLA